MRLLWASVLVLLPLLAEFADAQKCAGQPDAPDYATVRCFKKRNTCRATCQQGYIFSEKNSKMAVYDCEGGEWVMKGGEDRCTPECDPPCENGECIEPDTCDCDEGFAGDYCEEELEDEEEEEEYMTTTEEPITEAVDEDEDEEEDNYGDEEGDYGDDYDEDEENNDEEEDEDAVEGEGDDDEEHEDGAESTVEPEGGDDVDEDDHEDVDETDDDDVDENVDDNGDDEEVDDAEAGGDDDEDEAGDNTPDTAAYGGVSEVLPKVLVGSAALLIVRLL